MKKNYMVPETSFETMNDSEDLLTTSPIVGVNTEAEEVTEVDGRESFHGHSIWDDED